MHHRFTRQELYNLVWTEPVQKVAAGLGISDVGLKKVCRAADIPVPERGYWAKLQAGKSVAKQVLPIRPLGLLDEVQIGREQMPRAAQELTPDPLAPPVFHEPISRSDRESSQARRKGHVCQESGEPPPCSREVTQCR